MQKLFSAVHNFQKDLKPIDKDASNPFFKSRYATLSNIFQTIQPKLTENGLTVVQMMTSDNGNPALKTIIAHESGEIIEDVTPVFLGRSPIKDSEGNIVGYQENIDPQAHGSAITYARRYALCSALGIVVDEDDDGNAASKPVKTYNQPVNQPSKPFPPSEAQKAKIKELAEMKGITNKEIVIQGKFDTANLTGGKYGTASKLISWLQEYKPRENLPIIDHSEGTWNEVIDSVAESTPF